MISNVSFTSNNEVQIPSWMCEHSEQYLSTDSTARNVYERQPRQDEYVQTTNNNSNRSKRAAMRRAEKQRIQRQKAAIALLCLILGAGGGAAASNSISASTHPQQDWSYLEDYIADVSENGADADELEALYAKLEEQNETATWFRDGNFVYYTINPDTRISAADFKELFDIEDGVLKKYNHLDPVYEDTEPGPDGHSGIWNYDAVTFSEGTTIKVPVSAIGADGISLD